MTADEARGCVTTVRWLLREVMRTLSRPRPDWGHAAVMLDWAATLCMYKCGLSVMVGADGEPVTVDEIGGSDGDR